MKQNMLTKDIHCRDIKASVMKILSRDLQMFRSKTTYYSIKQTP